MANKRITNPAIGTLTVLAGADLFNVVDVDDLTDDPGGTTKKITRDNVAADILDAPVITDGATAVAEFGEATDSTTTGQLIVKNTNQTEQCYIKNHGANVSGDIDTDVPTIIHKAAGTFQIFRNLDWTTASGWHKPSSAKVASGMEVGAEGITLWVADTGEANTTFGFRIRCEAVNRGIFCAFPLWTNEGSESAPAHSFNSHRTSGMWYDDHGTYPNVRISSNAADGINIVSGGAVVLGNGFLTAVPQVANVYVGVWAEGTNVAAAQGRLIGPLGTGTGAEATLRLQVGSNNGLGSGGTLHTVVNAAEFDANLTAGNTRMLLWDVDTGALVRVSVGAADSGGVGFKVLRIPN